MMISPSYQPSGSSMLRKAVTRPARREVQSLPLRVTSSIFPPSTRASMR
jgi:hypothetical protein